MKISEFIAFLPYCSICKKKISINLNHSDRFACSPPNSPLYHLYVRWDTLDNDLCNLILRYDESYFNLYCIENVWADMSRPGIVLLEDDVLSILKLQQ